MISIAFIIFTLLVLLLAFYQWQYYMVFSPTYHRERSLCEKCSLLSIFTDDKVELEGVLYEPSDAKRTLLFFAGRSHDVVGIINRLSLAYPSLRIISFNYRSYGKSGGVVSEKNLLGDSLKIAKLVQKNYGDFYTLGYSLGSNLAAYVASKHQVKALFLIGAFDSIASLAKSRLLLFRYKFTTAEYVANVKADTYLYVSKDDEITYIQNARALQKCIKNLKGYDEYQGVSHKELLWEKEVITKINKVF